MNPAKLTRESLTQWTNGIVLLTAIVTLIARSDFLTTFDWGQQAGEVLLSLLAVANMIIRQFFTSQPLTMFRR